ncbi:MAG: hypothetical protein GXX90_07365 [Microbacteriaceae bacterium]|nr:hypothetical protein [Microbacteriaceae bacterium]
MPAVTAPPLLAAPPAPDGGAVAAGAGVGSPAPDLDRSAARIAGAPAPDVDASRAPDVDRSGARIVGAPAPDTDRPAARIPGVPAPDAGASSDADADAALEEIRALCRRVVDGVDVRLDARAGHWPSGAGMRGARRWCADAPCCPGGSVAVLADRRRRCGRCGHWWTASHSDGLLVLARSGDPVGVDVQVPRRRPAALRRLAAASGVPAPSLGHWALAEAVLKAVGRAHAVPGPGGLPLPAVLAGRLRWRLPEAAVAAVAPSAAGRHTDGGSTPAGPLHGGGSAPTRSLLGGGATSAGPMLGGGAALGWPLLGGGSTSAGPLHDGASTPAGPMLGGGRTAAGPLLGGSPIDVRARVGGERLEARVLELPAAGGVPAGSWLAVVRVL